MSETLINKKLRRTFKTEKTIVRFSQNFGFEGEMKQFQRNGHGKFYLDNESYYQGYFQNGELNGEGEYFLAFTGWYYKGNFNKGEKHGKGTLQKQNYIFNGNFHQGIKHGDFEEIFKDKGFIQTGKYINGVLQGLFRRFLIDHNTPIIQCNLINGLKEGQGIYEDQNTIYDGNFQKDQKHGQGQIKDKINGIIYEGQFLNNKPNKIVNCMKSQLLIENIDKNGQVQYNDLKPQNDKYKIESSKVYLLQIKFYLKEIKKIELEKQEIESKQSKKEKQQENDQVVFQLIEEESNRSITYFLTKINSNEQETSYNIDFYNIYNQIQENQEPFELDFDQVSLQKPLFKSQNGTLDIKVIFPNNIQSGSYELVIKDNTIQTNNFNKLDDLKFQLDILSKNKN